MEPVYRSVVGLCVATFRAQGWDVRVQGTEHVPTAGAGVIASNHISYLDFVFAGYGVLQAPGRRLVRWAAKKETFDHPVSGPLMRAMRHIPVDRGGRASEAIEHATGLLRDGELVGMFPESTISRSFVPLPGKTGTVRMAQAAGAPIVPCALWGSQRLFTKGRPRRLGQRDLVITVRFGEPLEVAPGDDPETATRELMSRIGAMVDTAQRTHPQRPTEDEDPWWVPAHLGGSAPTPEEAEALARTEAERRRARRAAGEG
ncbi:MAG: lysophospholipid acyltransferase family protein [Actinomycetes bacterium]